MKSCILKISDKTKKGEYTMYRIQCPACKNNALVQTSNAYQCLLCGYLYSDLLYKKENEIKVMTQEEQTGYELNQIAQNYFQSVLLNMIKKKHKAVTYLRKRGFCNQEDIEHFGFGYDNGLLVPYLLKLGYTENQLYYFGLMKYQNDFFNGRLTVPIKDSVGRIIGFGARTLEDDALKYINTAENPIFAKKAVFFGIYTLNFQMPIILCEGFFDCISLQKKGFNALATMGTALTMEHAILLKEINQPLYLAYDNDKAGQKAIMQNMRLLQSVGLTCKWVYLNDCKDPDEFLHKYEDKEFKKNIIQAKNRKQAVLNNLDIADITEVIQYLV